MALREFTDPNGESWKAWDITPDQLHPSTRTEDYLQGFLDGWLVFETLDGREKRRLYPVPVDWQEMGDAQLAALCERADSVRGTGRAARAAGGEAPPPLPGRRAAEARGGRPPTRTFLYPGGRVWTVGEQYVQLRDGAGQLADTRMVLRFTSGVRSLDLLAWPDDWAQYTDEELAELLTRAFPRDRLAPNVTEFHRRRTDQRA